MVLWALLACTDEAPGPDDTAPATSPEDRAGPTDTGTDTATETDPCTTPALAVGTGIDAYTPLTDGDPLTVVFGPQGGWHVDVGAEVFGVEQIVSIESELQWGAEARSLTGTPLPQTLALVPSKPCGWSLFGQRAFLDPALFDGDDAAGFVCGLEGQPGTLRLQVTDVADAVTLDDEVAVVLRRDPEQDCG